MSVTVTEKVHNAHIYRTADARSEEARGRRPETRQTRTEPQERRMKASQVVPHSHHVGSKLANYVGLPRRRSSNMGPIKRLDIPRTLVQLSALPQAPPPRFLTCTAPHHAQSCHDAHAVCPAVAAHHLEVHPHATRLRSRLARLRSHMCPESALPPAALTSGGR